MRFIINPETDRVITATGQAFEAFNLTPERADVLLQAIDAAGGRATTGQLAQALGCSIPDASRLLGELSDRGSVRSIMEMHRPIWERRTLDVNSALIREEYAPRILAFLVGRREMPGAIASALGLPRDEIAETCKFLMVSGQLVGTHIGAATVYALDIRGTTRVDVEAAARVAPSPQARFQTELAALPPEKPLRLVMRQPTPPTSPTLPTLPTPPSPSQLRLRPQAAVPFASSRRGRLEGMSRAVLEVFREPLKLRDAIRRLGLDESHVWARVKAMRTAGYLTRCAPSTYVLTADGVRALRPLKNARPVFSRKIPPPPAGEGWTPERTAWLTEHYARLGHRGAARMLGLNPGTVWARADKLNLKFGDIPGYILLIDLARDVAAMHDLKATYVYTNLWARASRAGVFKYGDGDLDRESRRVLVPVRWADEVRLERTPPTDADMPLTELMARTGLSKSQAGRRAAPTYLRTVTGGQPCSYLSRGRGEALVMEYSGKPARHEPGKAGLLAALEAAGPHGLTEKELTEALGVTRAAVRHHVRQLQPQNPQPLQKCRTGTCVDPTVWRLACHAAAPQPAQRYPDTSKWGNKTGKRKRATESALEEAAD